MKGRNEQSMCSPLVEVCEDASVLHLRPVLLSADDVPPGIRGASLKRICQKYADKLRYATFYDSSRHLPLYSAYVFKKSDGKRRMDTPWMYEPQLVSDDENGNMKALPLTEVTPPLIEDSQAVLEDYTDAVEYKRGSLNPDLHQAEPDDKSSTYTLTNVVPLITEFLDTSWNPYLDMIRRRLNNFCHGQKRGKGSFALATWSSQQKKLNLHRNH
uniref:endonuclease domain-containing 1 protein-like n=1 Tax=Monopterus albus TaxID=43700 RepID=UPI0009B4DAD5|nr:endonuclease domain-containing 1 protein-like [Monopterus albus]